MKEKLQNSDRSKMTSPLRSRKGASLGVVATAIFAVVAAGTTSVSSAATPVSTKLTSSKVVLTIDDETGFPLTDKLAAAFTKQHPNITFKINRDSFANLTANAPRLMSSNNAPDLIRLPTIGNAVKNGLLLNLDPYFKAYSWNKWSAAQLAGMRVNPKTNVRGSGSLYQLGLGYSVTGVFMNMALAKTVGITTVPTTLAEFEADLAAAKAGGIVPMTEGDKDGVVNFTVQAAMNDYGNRQKLSDWINNVPGATYDTPGNIQGANLIRSWADKGYFNEDINAVDYFTFTQNFVNGKGLFSFNGNWEAADVQAKLGSDARFFLFPAVQEGAPHVAMGAPNSFSVPAKSKHSNEIVYFLNWIHSNPVARQIVLDVSGATPGGDPALPLPKVAKGSMTEQGLQMAAQLSKDNGYIDFMANATAGIYANAIIPESQLLVGSKITGTEFVKAVQAEYAKELAQNK
jgi:multiple sugar transport system substrate-binding protein/raffinose/stachyose/melibiose transport system substrate-binding protein